jgi:hypothetical protein
MTTETDTDLIASESGPVTLVSGRQVNVERLRTRQTMRLMKILTRGGGAALADIDLSSGDQDAAVALLGAVIFSIPEAEDETIDFVRSMVTPVGLVADPRSRPEIEVNDALFANLADEFENPELDDLVTVLERVIKVEAPHLIALGKRLALLVKTFQQSETAKAPAKKRTSSSRSGSAA